ncbi:hypothetical protein V8E52_009081, partial [Russula decolorans]
MTSRRLWQFSSNDHLQIFPQNICRYTRSSCTTQMFSRLLNALRLAPPQCPNVPALTAQFSQYATSFARSGFNIRTLIPPLFEVAVRVRASGELCGAAEEFGRTPEIGWTPARVTQADPRGLQRRQLALYVHTDAGRTSPIAILVNAILAELNGPQLLAPAALLGDLANMIVFEAPGWKIQDSGVLMVF